MGVEQVARTMARRVLQDAVADASIQRSRQVLIGRGLIGAVINALDKGVLEGEVADVLGAGGGMDALRAALEDSPKEIADGHRETLLRLLSAGLEPGLFGEGGPSNG